MKRLVVIFTLMLQAQVYASPESLQFYCPTNDAAWAKRIGPSMPAMLTMYTQTQVVEQLTRLALGHQRNDVFVIIKRAMQ